MEDYTILRGSTAPGCLKQVRVWSVLNLTTPLAMAAAQTSMPMTRSRPSLLPVSISPRITPSIASSWSSSIAIWDSGRAGGRLCRSAGLVGGGLKTRNQDSDER